MQQQQLAGIQETTSAGDWPLKNLRVDAQSQEDTSVISSSDLKHGYKISGFANQNFGQGSQSNAQGHYVAQGGASQYITGGGSVYIGRSAF